MESMPPQVEAGLAVKRGTNNIRKGIIILCLISVRTYFKSIFTYYLSISPVCGSRDAFTVKNGKLKLKLQLK